MPLEGPDHVSQLLSVHYPLAAHAQAGAFDYLVNAAGAAAVRVDAWAAAAAAAAGGGGGGGGGGDCGGVDEVCLQEIKVTYRHT